MISEHLEWDDTPTGQMMKRHLEDFSIFSLLSIFWSLEDSRLWRRFGQQKCKVCTAEPPTLHSKVWTSKFEVQTPNLAFSCWTLRLELRNSLPIASDWKHPNRVIQIESSELSRLNQIIWIESESNHRLRQRDQDSEFGGQRSANKFDYRRTDGCREIEHRPAHLQILSIFRWILSICRSTKSESAPSHLTIS